MSCVSHSVRLLAYFVSFLVEIRIHAGKSVARATTTNTSRTYNMRFVVRPFFDECACFCRFEAPCPVAPGFRVERLNHFFPAVFLATIGLPFICHRGLHNSRARLPIRAELPRFAQRDVRQAYGRDGCEVRGDQRGHGEHARGTL